jgi:hypothetical protein
LLRLAGAGTVKVKNNISKEEVLVQLRRILGPFVPPNFSGFRNNFHAFSWVLSSYTGRPVSEESAMRCVSNRRHQGYEYTKTFYEVLGGRAWPPSRRDATPLTPPQAKATISTPPPASAFKSALEVSSWADISREFTF